MAGGGHASLVRVVNQSVIDAARDGAGGIRAIPIANDTAVKGAAADCGADFGAHVAVIDGDIALGMAHQTAQALIGAARNGALDVEVADGGAVDVVERGAEVLGGSAVEGQRVVLSVERAFERVTALACHGLAAEAVGCQAAIQGVAEPVPAVGGLDGIFVGACLLEVAGVGC